MSLTLKNRIMAVAALPLLVACAEQTALSPAEIQALPKTHQEIADTISQGFKAAEAGDNAGAAKAGTTLIALNAQPLRGMPNLANNWTNQPAMPPMRGRVRGPGYRVNALGSGQVDQFGEIFYGVEEATISVSGEGRYMVAVLDEDGRPPLCEAETMCRFTPDVTGQYQIVIRNEGDAGRYVFIAD